MKKPVEVKSRDGLRIIIEEDDRGDYKLLVDYNNIKVDIRNYEFKEDFLIALKDGIDEFLK